jgi:hypothetical protein
MDDDRTYENIRDPELLGPLLGQCVVEITQHSKEEWAETGESYFMLHFENGYTLTIKVTDAGFDISAPD